MDNRTNLLKRMSAAGFAMHEFNMYLDTHPGDKAALEKSRKYKDIYNQLKTEYEAKYGPISMQDAGGDKRWDWVNNPWPWEEGAN